MTIATARDLVRGGTLTSHVYGPLMPYFDDANARMLQSVAESGGLTTYSGLVDLHE